MENRRRFIKKLTVGITAATVGGVGAGFTAKSYRRIIGANSTVNVGVVGFSDRFKNSLFPGFINHCNGLNFRMTALSDIWSKRREEGASFIKSKTGWDIAGCRNNDELYAIKDIDAVIISTADFQHALHLKEAAEAGKDAYVEKPFAETMDDANEALEACRSRDIVVQIGSQRRSGANYQAAYEYINSGKFGDIVMAEMSWNVNQPGRWRRKALCESIRPEDVDWQRFLLNRPRVEWDPRIYLEYRLFWPFSSGIPGQWMCHQIDTVHWFTGLNYPRSVVCNGGIYQWKDGRNNADTLTAVFDYGPDDDLSKGFQVVYSSRFTNSAGGIKELYYSNGGTLNLDTNEISSLGGLNAGDASSMGLSPNLLPSSSLPTARVSVDANTGGDPLTSAHMKNWMECILSRRQTNAPVEAGYHHAIACTMANAALRTRLRVHFDENKNQVVAGGNVFKY
ncbi:Gfo/Idh/MocA family protein [Parapedobacter deserti]|uniref:Gfo/Idh/MocA family protein n=1 Tax=Parapedobacter deserti TaxID=1912957 RepID=A0ABV7JEC8_9SPHI